MVSAYPPRGGVVGDGREMGYPGSNSQAPARSFAPGETVSDVKRRGIGRPEGVGLSLEEAALLLRKWTPKEKALVISLRETKGWGPRKISKETGFPEGQIRFWIYKRKGYKSTRSKDGKGIAKRNYYRTKYNDWFRWKAATLTSGFRARARYLKVAQTAPKPRTLEAWLRLSSMLCRYCSVQLDEKSLGVDHATPLSRGGTSEIENLVVCCRDCNAAKGVMTEAEFLALRALVATWEDGGKSLFARLKQGYFRQAMFKKAA